MKTFRKLFQIDAPFSYESARILVVDDEPLVIRPVVQILNQAGFKRVESENDPRRALHTVQKFRPDLILLDLIMPEMTGVEFLEQLKSSPDFDEISVLILSAGRMSDKYKSLRLGAVGFINKPVDPDQLVQSVQQTLLVD